MQRSVLVVLAWPCARLFAGVGASEVTPTQKVISMLEGMLAKGDAEMKQEQVTFAGFSQFCQETTTDKNREIDEANERIEELSVSIEKASAAKAQAHQQQLLHDTDVFHWTGDVNASTNVRGLEKEAFVKTHQDYSESIDALNRAVSVLSDAAHDTQQEALMQLQNLNLVPLEAKQQVMEFLQSAGSEPTVPEVAAYTFNSHGVLEMLKKLLVKFTDELRELENTERDSMQNHQLLVQSLTASIKQANAQSAKAVAKQNALTEQISADTAEKDENIAVRDAATKYLADLTATCEQKSSDFKSRQSLRTDELEALQKAIAVLQGDVAPIAAKHLPHDEPSPESSSLAQLFMRSRVPTQQRLVQFLESQAGRLNSRVLSAVALSAAKDPFTKVKKMIEDLITRLQSEAGEEADHHAWCDSELAVNEQTRKQKTTSAESLHTKIDVLQASIADRTQQIKELNNATARAHADLKKAQEVRSAEHDENTAQIQDSTGAIEAVAKAIEILKEFYDKAGLATVLTQDEPTIPKIFEDPYKGMQSENGGVIGMLEVISSDFSRLKAETTASEAKAVEEFRSFKADTEALIEQNTKDVRQQEVDRQDELQALETTKADLAGTQKELGASLDYFDELKSSCITVGSGNAILDAQNRVENRQAEIDSLQKALEILTP